LAEIISGKFKPQTPAELIIEALQNNEYDNFMVIAEKDGDFDFLHTGYETLIEILGVLEQTKFELQLFTLPASEEE